jgi:hypothetical protein
MIAFYGWWDGFAQRCIELADYTPEEGITIDAGIDVSELLPGHVLQSDTSFLGVPFDIVRRHVLPGGSWIFRSLDDSALDPI